ncbi:MAG: hypothetical protein GC193_11985 [Cryomorphaceae bacterium]|nr:hypothetical protein [Cryomorphaceae bacterium]
MITHSWARYKGKPIHIDEVTLEMREEGEFFNVVSGKKMTAYLEGKFQRHFHHLVPDKTSKETYLHETAKQVFLDSYEQALQNDKPFQLEYAYDATCNRLFKETGVKCKLGSRTDKFDLTRVYDTFFLEKGYEGFQPDIRLSSTKNPLENIFIEIAVTHESSSKKLKSGHKLIEIKIRNDEDIKALRKNHISVLNANTSLYNFRKKGIESEFCLSSEKGCREFRKVFIQYKNGTYEFPQYYLENIWSDISINHERIKNVDYQVEKTFVYLNDKENKEDYLKRNGLEIRECKLCKYVAHNREKIGKKNFRTSLFCKFLKENVTDEKAELCEYFRK